ncbi:MAG: Bug family tripartite tricarboxylate transporter substrate binding protein [Acetobacteraceae bacterium]
MTRMLAALLAVCLAIAGAAQAQDKYPSKPIRLIVPFAVGGGTDIPARVLGAKMSELLGQQIVIDNRPGAGGNLGTDLAAKAPPDGYTILLGSISALAINPGLYKKMPYDPIKDFAPIGLAAIGPIALVVHKSVPATDLKSLLDQLKNNPGKYSYGSSGMGSILHLCGESLKMRAGGLDITHVPYRGSGPMMIDLAAGQIPMAFDGMPTVLPQVQAGTIRPIAMGTKERARAMPDLPTLDELGMKGYECYFWITFLAPAKTPKPIITLLADTLNKALDDPAVFKRLQELGFEPTPNTSPEKLAAFLKSEMDKWAPVIKASGAHLD